jgi:diguanylate cyclase (GGDEF)-like protein
MRMRIRQERSARHFHMLFETAHHFTTALDASKVFEILFDMLPRVTTFSSATAITFDPNANTQTVRKCLGRPAPFREGIVLPINDGLYSAVYRKNERIHLPDLATMQGRFYRLAPDEPRSTGRSLLALPLADDELHCRGLVALEGDMPHQFDGVVEQVISTLVDSAAVALVRALLYHNMVMLATTDGLTHLCNHRSFQEQLEKELERSGRYERKLSLLLMDIDHFKSFNDTYGHPVGDLVLREIAGCIRRSVRSNDIPARYGGEEFTVVIPETDEQGAMITAERIRQTIEQHVIRTDSKELHVTVSIGCATFPDLATTQQALIDAADKALYYSKEHGRNRCTLYRRPM